MAEPVDVQVAGISRDIEWIKKSIDSNNQQALGRHVELVEKLDKFIGGVDRRFVSQDNRLRKLEYWRNGLASIWGMTMVVVVLFKDSLNKLFR